MWSFGNAVSGTSVNRFSCVISHGLTVVCSSPLVVGSMVCVVFLASCVLDFASGLLLFF